MINLAIVRGRIMEIRHGTTRSGKEVIVFALLVKWHLQGETFTTRLLLATPRGGHARTFEVGDVVLAYGPMVEVPWGNEHQAWFQLGVFSWQSRIARTKRSDLSSIEAGRALTRVSTRPTLEDLD